MTNTVTTDLSHMLTPASESSTLTSDKTGFQKPVVALACIGLALGTSGMAFYRYRDALAPALDYMLMFSMISIVILIGMSGLYYHAYNFYQDIFYLLLSAGWVANAVYIFFEGFFPSIHGTSEYGLWIDLITISSLLPFYLAGSVYEESHFNYKRLFVPCLVFAFWIVVRFAPGITLDTKFAIVTVVVCVFAFISLISVARSLMRRLNPAVRGTWARRLVRTFQAYAYLQFVYLLVVIPSLGLPSNWTDSITLYADIVLKIAFPVALLLKILNAISALSVLRHDFADLSIKYIQAQEQLTRRSGFEEIGLLTASILHEIRNPLGVIAANISELKDKYQANDSLVAELEKVDEQRQKIYTATRIIPYLRSEREFYEARMTKVSVGDLVRRTIKNLRAEFKIADIEFRYLNKEETFFVKAYAQMLEEAMLNILKNSIEAIRQANRKQGVIYIEMGIVSGPERQMRLDIRDNGEGIPPQNIAKVKLPLFSTRTSQKENSGLGLFITDRILRIHGGSLEIKSEVNVGSTVSLILPLLEFHKKSANLGQLGGEQTNDAI